MDGKLIEMLSGCAKVRSQLGPRIEAAVYLFQDQHRFIPDLFYRGFQRALELLFAHDGCILFRQRPSHAARDFEKGITRDAEFLFHHGG